MDLFGHSGKIYILGRYMFMNNYYEDIYLTYFSLAQILMDVRMIVLHQSFKH